jgi:hypothetical protein
VKRPLLLHDGSKPSENAIVAAIAVAFFLLQRRLHVAQVGWFLSCQKMAF